MSKKIKIVGIAGSLRKDSVNRKLLRVASELLGDEIEYKEIDISDIPLFNEDFEHPAPASVLRIHDEVLKADAIIFATPEYNGGMPGVLKNVIDWLSRPLGDSKVKPLVNKTAYIVGGTSGMSGTITAQEHLRAVLTYMGVFVLPSNRATVPSIFSNLDENGSLVLNELALGFLKQGIHRFVDFTKALLDSEA